MQMKKHIPNILSTIRLGMAITLPFVFFKTTLLNALIFYIVGDLTDAVDGYLARKWKVQSKYGKVVDPIADKLLNGLALLLTSVFINPLMFILTGFEAFIAGTNLLRVKKKRDVNVIQIGRIKTVAMFFAIISTMAVPLNPSLKIISNIMIGLTAGLQSVTAYKYLREYRNENQEEKISKEKLVESYKGTSNNKEKIKKLKYFKQLLSSLCQKKKLEANTLLQNNIILEEAKLNAVDQLDKENLGISRTLKK